MLRSFFLLFLLASANAFQFMSKWKITPPADIEREAATKAKFGDKSKCKTTMLYSSKQLNCKKILFCHGEANQLAIY